MSYGRPFAIISIILSLLLLGGILYEGVTLQLDFKQEIDGYLIRADSATTAGNMAWLIGQALEGMENRDIVSGNWSWILTDNPNTSMDISVHQLRSLENRLIAIESNENISSIDYAMSLDESKRSFGKIEIKPFVLYTKKFKTYLYPEVLIGLVLFIFLFGCFIFPTILWRF